jgi:hypothetical protein
MSAIIFTASGLNGIIKTSLVLPLDTNLSLPQKVKKDDKKTRKVEPEGFSGLSKKGKLL